MEKILALSGCDFHGDREKAFLFFLRVDEPDKIQERIFYLWLL